MKNGLNSINILYTGSHKTFPIWAMRENLLKRIVSYLYCTKYSAIELVYFIEMHENMFHIQKHGKHFCYIMGYASKRL